MTDKWPRRFELIRQFGWLALVGAVLVAIALGIPESYRAFPLVIGVLFLLPCLVYSYVVVIWHWKDRYVGTHSDLWGALILLETSGWFKIAYFIRHIFQT
jgi:hypothetical protein